MANAKPSGPGYAVAQGGARPEQNHGLVNEVVSLKNGDVVNRVLMQNGNVQETALFAGDFKGKDVKVKPITEAEWDKKAEAAKKGAK